MRRSIAGLLVALLVFLIGCDSTDPIDGGSVPASVVAGSYKFQFYSFEPSAPVLPAYNLLDTLVKEETELLLADSRDFVLKYRYEGGRTRLISGTFSVTPTEVTLRGAGSDTDKFRELLFNTNAVTLKRDPTDPKLLSGAIKEVIDLGALSPRYKGIPPVEGTLRVRLRQ